MKLVCWAAQAVLPAEYRGLPGVAAVHKDLQAAAVVPYDLTYARARPVLCYMCYRWKYRPDGFDKMASPCKRRLPQAALAAAYAFLYVRHSRWRQHRRENTIHRTK